MFVGHFRGLICEEVGSYPYGAYTMCKKIFNEKLIHSSNFATVNSDNNVSEV